MKLFICGFRNADRALSTMDKLLITLRFLATGDFYISMGDFTGIHKTTAGRTIKNGIQVLCNLFQQIIKLPQTELEKQVVQTDFYDVSYFPRVIGAIDCTHIKIQSPGGDNAEIFRNRKGYFSLNCQVVCNAKLKIMDLVCRWPGSASDSHIFENSAIKMRLENGEMGNGVLLGDRGYALRPYLLTPIAEPQNEVENLYNEAQIRTRNVIERLFGTWKRRFPVLSAGIRCKLEFAQMIIVACAVLHNIAVDQNEENFDNDIEFNVEAEENIRRERNGDIGARVQFLDYFQNLLNNHRNNI